MGRKKKKRRPEETPGLGASAGPEVEADLDASDSAGVAEEEPGGPESLATEPPRELEATPAGAEARPKAEGRAPGPPGLLARLSAWWKGGPELAGEPSREKIRWTP